MILASCGLYKLSIAIFFYYSVQYVFHIDAGWAEFAAATATDALGLALLIQRADEFVEIPVEIAVLQFRPEIFPAGDFRECRERAGIPFAATRTFPGGIIGFVLHVKAVAERADISADAAAEADFFQLIPDFTALRGEHRFFYRVLVVERFLRRGSACAFGQRGRNRLLIGFFQFGFLNDFFAGF